MSTSSSQSIPARSAHRLFAMVCMFLSLWIIIAAGVGIVYLEAYASTDRIFYGVFVGSIDASGLTKQGLAEKIESAGATIKRQGVEAHYEDLSHIAKLAVIPLENISFQGDIPLQALGEIFEFDAQKTAESAYALGRKGTLFQEYADRISFFLTPRRFTPELSFNEELFLQLVKKEVLSLESPIRDAAFAFDEKNKKITIEPERFGFELDSQKAVQDTRAFLRMIQRPRIILVSRLSPASLTSEDLLDFKQRAQQIIEQAPITLEADKKTWQISSERLASWLTVEKDASQKPALLLNKTLVASYMEKEIAPAVHIEAKTARFEVKDGRVTAFDQQKNGTELDSESSIAAILSGIFEKNQKTIPLTMKETSPPLSTSESQPLVYDILASAKTDFRGSPKNRIFNITLGAGRIHGVLIEPGKEFSLISFLGKIDKKSGFLPELVIKGSKTTPEFGGGLCQVSTTLFRTVAAAGLPVLERKNHSYRVPYYEPPIGFDATVYYPKPDFRFLNDTGNPILIQTAVRGTKIKMTLWGTKDGRTTEIDTPTVFNRKSPGSTKIIETDTLKPGEEKCIERAHAGADAVFERRVTYPDGEIKKDIFKSHYVAWPAVCLVGRKTEDVGLPEDVTSTSSSQQATSTQSTLTPQKISPPLVGPTSTQ